MIGDAFCAGVAGQWSIDQDAALVANAQITWRQATLLRAMGRYLRQTSVSLSETYLVGGLDSDPEFTRSLLCAFENRFDPRRSVDLTVELTDDIVDGTIAHPPKTLCTDGDDTYLVVAADKGTASFSDVANAVAAEYDFWLGDAFAFGGSAGCDHKAMGITARGAWLSVERHFREAGTDINTEPFTAIGIGEMSGDVFGNGMLLADTTRLIAAFDHRHIFIDPDPDAGRALAARRELFLRPRSSWADCDRSAISPGGGVWT